MKTPHSTVYRFTSATVTAANKLTVDTISEHDQKTAMLRGEPLIVAMDALLQYAQAYGK